MRSRPLAWSILLFQFIWMNVIVPGHTRGIVQLAGATQQPTAVELNCPMCCCCEKPTPDSKKNQPAPPAPTGPARTCAICSFAAHMGILPTIDLSLAPLRLLCRVKNYAAICMIPRAVLTPFDGRGPPASA